MEQEKNIPVIEINNVSMKFGSNYILENVNLNFYKTERIAILGSNGAGKSTLINIISQILTPTSGKLAINIDGNVKREIGIQFQEGNWPKGLTPERMIKFYKGIYPNFNDKREKELEEIFEISDFYKKDLAVISGGQKQRFNAMLAVLNNPKIIILDELTTGLDMKLQFKLIDFFKKSTIENHQTLLIVSHNPEEVEALCTRMLIIGDKKILFDKQIDEIKKEGKTIRKIMIDYFEKGKIYE